MNCEVSEVELDAVPKVVGHVSHVDQCVTHGGLEEHAIAWEGRVGNVYFTIKVI